jgi:putative endonuclease
MSITSRTPKQQTGDAAETVALQYLQKHSCTLEARNVRYKSGELDLVMRDATHLIFIEVRTRREGALNGRFGGALASITPAKQARLVRAAQHYLMRFGDRPPPARFDAVLVGEDGQIEWLKNIIST